MYVTHECICMSHMSAYVCHTRVHMYVTHDLNSCVTHGSIHVTHEYTCMSHIAHELVSIYGMMHTVYVRWYTIST